MTLGTPPPDTKAPSYFWKRATDTIVPIAAIVTILVLVGGICFQSGIILTNQKYTKEKVIENTNNFEIIRQDLERDTDNIQEQLSEINSRLARIEANIEFLKEEP